MAGSVSWSREEEKAFENAIAMHRIEKEESKEQWEKIASTVPSKSLEELKQHHEILVEDVTAIEAGQVPLPCYKGEEASSSAKDHFQGVSTAAAAANSDRRSNSGYGNRLGLTVDSSGHGGKGSSRSDQERRKGIPWTKEEHRQVRERRLEKHFKELRDIRTPTQVAIHAQKYFIRLNSMNRDRRRSSIHDIMSVNNGDTSHQAPITGQQANANSACAAAMRQSVKQWALPHLPSLGMFGAPVVCPIAAPGHIESAVGTPVMLPPAHHPHSPPHIVLVAYPMGPPPMQQ